MARTMPLRLLKRYNKMKKSGSHKAGPRLVARLKGETPRFFRRVRTAGLALASVGGVLIAAPIVLPAAVVTVAGYMFVAGGIISALSQLTIKQDR